MDSASPLSTWNLSLGTWFRVQVRLSVWSIFLALLILSEFKDDLRLAISLVLMLFVVIVVHEFGHIWAARSTGGSGDEILIWPFGGLAYVRPARTFRSQFLTAAAGPVSHTLLCGLTLPFAVRSLDAAGVTLTQLLTPLYFPPVSLTRHAVGPSLACAFFWLNWQLLLLNILPIHPLDGWSMALAWASERWERFTARMSLAMVSFASSIILLMIGHHTKAIPCITLGSFLAVLSVYELVRLQFAVKLREMSGMDLMFEDEEESYVSEPVESPPGFFERWKLQREEQRREREERDRAETETRVDALLQKIQESGMNSLTDDERWFLKQASGRYRGTEK